MLRFVKMVHCRRDGGFRTYFFDVNGQNHGCNDQTPCEHCARCWRDVKMAVFAQKRRSARPARH